MGVGALRFVVSIVNCIVAVTLQFAEYCFNTPVAGLLPTCIRAKLFDLELVFLQLAWSWIVVKLLVPDILVKVVPPSFI